MTIVKRRKMNKNPFEKNINKICSICGKNYMADISGNGKCKNCGWYNNILGEENPNFLIFPNLVSLNKAKKLFRERKSLTPDLKDFLDAFEFYGETGFEYNKIEYDLRRFGEEGIEMSWGPEPNGIIYFKDKDDFIQNAKIDNEFVKDIWNKVEDIRYL